MWCGGVIADPRDRGILVPLHLPRLHPLVRAGYTPLSSGGLGESRGLGKGSSYMRGIATPPWSPSPAGVGHSPRRTALPPHLLASGGFTLGSRGAIHPSLTTGATAPRGAIPPHRLIPYSVGNVAVCTTLGGLGGVSSLGWCTNSPVDRGTPSNPHIPH